jgi:hypothetical protein
MGYHSGVYCVLRLGSQPGAREAVDAVDDALIEEIAQAGAARLGLARIVALHHRSSASYQIH